MLRHEHFEEICAAASIGQATPDELAELERHAADCPACQQTYLDYLSVAAQQFAAADQNLKVSPELAEECLDSDLLTRRFVDRAQREGIVFSHEAGRDVAKSAPVQIITRRAFPWKPLWSPLWSVAAMVLIAVSLPAGYMLGRRSTGRADSTGTSAAVPIPTANLTSTHSPETDARLVHLADQITELTAENRKLHATIDHLNVELREVNIQIASKEDDLQSVSVERQTLASRRDVLEAQREALEGRLKSAQQELAKSEAAANAAQEEIAGLRERSNSLQASLVADRSKIRGLTDELTQKSAALDQEHQLLAVGHDVTDLMGARNLHIVDVVDTDPRGKNRPAFGRVFFTEGKSLIFYAYDLNETRIEKANYQYRIWAKKEGGDKQVRNLGIFYADDKTQRRWAFKCTDPKMLNEIDSVFVTLEPAGSDPAHPKGQNLMYAYLRGQPNHP